MDQLQQIIYEIARALAWSLVGAFAMSFALAILLRTFDWCTPGIEEMEELKRGNVAVAIVLAAVIIAFGFVIGLTLHSPYS